VRADGRSIEQQLIDLLPRRGRRAAPGRLTGFSRSASTGTGGPLPLPGLAVRVAFGLAEMLATIPLKMIPWNGSTAQYSRPASPWGKNTAR
jgi:hypothetical protein